VSENEARAWYARLIKGWNDHDGSAMAEPFAEDGVIIGWDSELRSAVDRHRDVGHLRRPQNGRYAVKVYSVRSPGPQAVILRATAGLGPPGQTAIRSETNSHQT
jgi:uncharacterized protein (TIGR02246 family)